MSGPFTHTFQVPEPEWVNCPDCEGAGGQSVDGEWQDCDSCDGEEGAMVWPTPGPSMTLSYADMPSA